MSVLPSGHAHCACSRQSFPTSSGCWPVPLLSCAWPWPEGQSETNCPSFILYTVAEQQDEFSMSHIWLCWEWLSVNCICGKKAHLAWRLSCACYCVASMMLWNFLCYRTLAVPGGCSAFCWASAPWALWNQQAEHLQFCCILIVQPVLSHLCHLQNCCVVWR